MSPREKAKELIDKYIPLSSNWDEKYGWTDDTKRAKRCALIYVDEILNNEQNTMRGISEDLHDEYWERVKKEIENL